MITSVKWILYLSLKLSMFVAFAGIIYSIIMILVGINETKYWLIRLGAFLVAAVIIFSLQILRRSKFPIPGKDYK